MAPTRLTSSQSSETVSGDRCGSASSSPSSLGRIGSVGAEGAAMEAGRLPRSGQALT